MEKLIRIIIIIVIINCVFLIGSKNRKRIRDNKSNGGYYVLVGIIEQNVLGLLQSLLLKCTPSVK